MSLENKSVDKIPSKINLSFYPSLQNTINEAYASIAKLKEIIDRKNQGSLDYNRCLDMIFLHREHIMKVENFLVMMGIKQIKKRKNANDNK